MVLRLEKQRRKSKQFCQKIITKIAFTEFPGNMDSLGSEKVSDLTKQRFYWPYTAKNINFYLTKDADLLTCD